MEILHLDYRPGTAGLILPLQSLLQKSSAAELRKRYSRWKELGLAELGMAVATRFSLTLRVASRLAELLQQLRNEIEESGKIDELLDEGYVYAPKDSRVLYDLCTAVDAFYFEYRSCYEVVGKFATTFCREMLAKNVTQDELVDVLTAAGVATDWITSLRENRNLFFHETAPWIALQIHERHPVNCSIVVMKENTEELDDPTTFVTQEQIVATIDGLQAGLWAVHNWLKAQIAACETSTMGNRAT